MLEPLRVEHADEMVAVLDDPQLHTYIGGGAPATLDELTATYARQVVGQRRGRFRALAQLDRPAP